jgi:hypothetical protein
LVVVVVVVVGLGSQTYLPQSHSVMPTQRQLRSGRAHIGRTHLVVVVVVVVAGLGVGAWNLLWKFL